uniref:Uncharacterized protein n=1 Tax=Caenorhabditis japonica TaxID=281687 RepID=A0A8R1IPS7_CAEJA
MLISAHNCITIRVLQINRQIVSEQQLNRLAACRASSFVILSRLVIIAEIDNVIIFCSKLPEIGWISMDRMALHVIGWISLDRIAIHVLSGF